MSKCIVTYADANHAELLATSLPTFKAFADRHGYDLLVGEEEMVDHTRPAAWHKVRMLNSALKIFDVAVWFDADLVVVDPSEDFTFSEIKLFALVRHMAKGSEVPNSGMWALRRAAAPLLKAMWDLEIFWNHGWWEQAALLTLMGYTVPPEGSDFDETKCMCVHETYWTRMCEFLPVKWNSHPNYRAEKPKIVHCSYPTVEQRLEVMRALVRDPGYNYPEWPAKKKKEK